MDTDTLIGYRINGKAEIIKEPELKGQLLEELSQKQIHLSTQRLIKGLREEKMYRSFELTFPENVGLFKVCISEITEIGPTGKLKRQNTP